MIGNASSAKGITLHRGTRALFATHRAPIRSGNRAIGAAMSAIRTTLPPARNASNATSLGATCGGDNGKRVKTGNRAIGGADAGSIILRHGWSALNVGRRKRFKEGNRCLLEILGIGILGMEILRTGNRGTGAVYAVRTILRLEWNALNADNINLLKEAGTGILTLGRLGVVGGLRIGNRGIGAVYVGRIISRPGRNALNAGSRRGIEALEVGSLRIGSMEIGGAAVGRIISRRGRSAMSVGKPRMIARGRRSRRSGGTGTGNARSAISITFNPARTALGARSRNR